jgi:hypothetical protein
MVGGGAVSCEATEANTFISGFFELLDTFELLPFGMSKN